MSNSTTKEKDLFTCNSYISLFIDEKNDWCKCNPNVEEGRVFI